MLKTLVVYYSEGGGTEAVANELAEKFSADVERIDTVSPYPSDYEKMVEQGKREAESGATPAIKPLAHNPADYDVIVIGTPTWWYTMAPAILTFLRENSFKGKTVLPYQTHAGQPGHVVPDMRKELTGAMVFSGMRIEYDKYKKMTDRSRSELDEWIAAVKKELYK